MYDKYVRVHIFKQSIRQFDLTFKIISVVFWGSGGEIWRLAKCQYGQFLQRFCQSVLWEIWQSSQILDHLQQSLGKNCKSSYCLVLSVLKSTFISFHISSQLQWRVMRLENMLLVWRWGVLVPIMLPTTSLRWSKSTAVHYSLITIINDQQK